MPQVSSQVTANYRKTTTGSQLGTRQLQPLLIKTYNLDWGTWATDPSTQNPNIKVSEPGTNFSKVIRAIQDYAEIYFIGNPQVSAGGEGQVTECVVWVSSDTNNSGGELRSDGQWDALQNHIFDVVATQCTILVYYAVQDGWIWKANNYVSTQGNHPDYFPVIMTG
jgi:hypothetical protein